MSRVRLTKIVTPSTPATNTAEIFLDTADKHVKQIDDAGVVIDLAATGSFVPTSRQVNGHALTSDVTVTKSDLTLGNVTNDVQLPKAGGIMTGQFVESAVELTDGATPALDASLGNIFYLVAAGNRTIAVPSNAHAGQKIIIQHYASGGARTLVLNTGTNGFRFGSDITALTETASGKTDYIGCIYNGLDNKWDVVAYTKGF